MRVATRLGLLVGTTALALGLAAGTAAADTTTTAATPISVVVGPGTITVGGALNLHLSLGPGLLISIPGLTVGAAPIISIGG